MGGVGRPPPGHDPDEMEISEGPDDGKGGDDCQQRHDQGEGDLFEFDPRACPIDIRSLVKALIDGL